MVVPGDDHTNLSMLYSASLQSQNSEKLYSIMSGGEKQKPAISNPKPESGYRAKRSQSPKMKAGNQSKNKEINKIDLSTNPVFEKIAKLEQHILDVDKTVQNLNRAFKL